MPAAAPASSRIVATTDNIVPLLTLEQLKIDFAHVEKGVADLEAEHGTLPTVIEDDEDLGLATALAVKFTKAGKRCEEIRTEQNRPFLDATNLLNAHFKHDLQARLAKTKTSIETICTAYQRKKAAKEKADREELARDALERANAAAAQVTEAVKTGDVQAATTAVKAADSLTAFANKAAAAASAPVSSMAKTTTDAGSASLVDNWTFADLDLNTIDLNALRPFLNVTHIEQALRGFIKSGRREITGATIFNDSRSRFRG